MENKFKPGDLIKDIDDNRFPNYLYTIVLETSIVDIYKGNLRHEWSHKILEEEDFSLYTSSLQD